MDQIKQDPKFNVIFFPKVVAGLLCTDLAAGRRASELVRIEYEDLEAVLTIDDAAKRADAVISEAKFEELQPIDMPPKERVRLPMVAEN